MKILVIGGTGMFGSRLVELLTRDGAEVTIGGRTEPQGESAFLSFDRNGPLSGLAGFDVIVDAAGPFHAYGVDPYRIARAAIAEGAHYFDLCDNADFCQGISALDESAKAAGVCVASGLSSVPALSSAVVESLRGGQSPMMIESAILPGNKAPRGRAVIESILNQTGQDYVERRGGVEQKVRSWSDPKSYELAGIRRQGWKIEVPDQRLFPDHFGCPTVTFRAGLELGVMRYGLAALSWLRGKLGFGMPSWFVALMVQSARALTPFGSDRGGMVVNVTLPQGAGFIRKNWTMTARNGDGPYTPSIPIRAACRDLGALKSGAGPALSLVSLDQIEACFSDLDIETDLTATPVVPTFKQVLGEAFDTLPKAVRATHDAVTPRVFRGRANVLRGTGFQARVAAALVGFPPSCDDIDVEVTKTPNGDGETWVRRFGDKTFRSFLSPNGRCMREKFGLMNFEMNLHVQRDRLRFPVKSGRAGFLPFPRFLLPQSIASEEEIDGLFHFDVLLKAPTGATLVHYRGWLEQIEG